jgi:beta-glucosidase
MCGYNLVNGSYACGNRTLLNDILKVEWGYPGFVMSDWGAVKTVDFALAGLDQQSGEEADEAFWFSAPLKAAVQNGHIPATRLSEMVRRILYAQFAAGLFEHPMTGGPIDYEADAKVSRDIAAQGVVLLKNQGAMLPLAPSARTILVIGDYVEKGVLSGGGSSNVTAGHNQVNVPMSEEGQFGQYVMEQYQPSPPLSAIRARAPAARVLFDNGRNAGEAERKARSADLVIVFGNQWMTEQYDVPNMDLPRGQDGMISRVAHANPNTVVVLQTGGPVSMPWLPNVRAVIEAWYSGQQGGEVIADVLFGIVNPSGRLPMTFPRSIAQTPRPAVLDGADLPENVRFDVNYAEGADVGYRWFARQGSKPLYPFGHGLSYTTYRYSDLTVRGGTTLTVQFKVTNTGPRAGMDAPQLYLTGTPDGKLRRLIGFNKVSLEPGQSKVITLKADPRVLAQFEIASKQWRVAPGTYAVAVSHSAGDDALRGSATLTGASIGSALLSAQP